MPSPSPEHPGLFIRDPYKYSDAMLVIPPPLVECLQCFDGRQTELDLRAELVRITGELDVSDLQQNLIDTLSNAGFPGGRGDGADAGGAQARIRSRRGTGARACGIGISRRTRRMCNEMMREYMGEEASRHAAAGRPVRHRRSARGVRTEGGWQGVSRRLRMMLRPEHKDRTFVILATSHYGEPEKFRLTPRKKLPHASGRCATRYSPGGLAGPARRRSGVEMEDYCHSFEHTVELQVIFLQHMLGPDVKILPILVGSFARSIYQGGMPEDDDKVRAFFDVLSELREREGDELFWVMGVDMAHMGARYQDRFAATAGEGEMQEVAERDTQRIERINALDAGGFWELIRERQDDLKWCGSSPFYTFLRTAPKSRGELLNYEQWNIDEKSVVSFAGMGFRK